MNTLEILDLSETGVTDVSIEHLTKMKSLKLVFLDRSKVSPAGVEKLRRKRPDCRVIFGPRYKEVQSEEDTRLTG